MRAISHISGRALQTTPIRQSAHRPMTLFTNSRLTDSAAKQTARRRKEVEETFKKGIRKKYVSSHRASRNSESRIAGRLHCKSANARVPLRAPNPLPRANKTKPRRAVYPPPNATWKLPASKKLYV